MASPLVDTKPALPLVDGNNKSSGVGGCDVDKSATRENGIEHDSDLKISLLPAVFEVVRTMEEKDAGKVSASDVTNQLTQFHGKLKKAREAVEKHLPAATIGISLSAYLPIFLPAFFDLYRGCIVIRLCLFDRQVI